MHRHRQMIHLMPTGVAGSGVRAPSARGCAGSGVRTVGCARSGRSWQKPRPGSPGRPARSRPGLRVRESQSGHVPDLTPKHAGLSSSSWRDGTIRAEGIPLSATCHPSTTKETNYPRSPKSVTLHETGTTPGPEWGLPSNALPASRDRTVKIITTC